MATGKLVEAAAKVSGIAGAELPPYNPETQEITYEGNTRKVPDGTKFVLDDGRTFILHHPRMLKGGWKLMRPAKKKDGAAADTKAATKK